MKTPNRYRPGYRPRGFLLIVATAVLLMLPAAAAQAHDVLESSDPANGSIVGSVPAKIGLTFSNNPIAIGSVVRVEDATGTDQADGPVSIVDNHATQAVKSNAPEGRYTVTWRVVSSDGHPIEGTFTFTAGSANTASSSNTAATPSPSAAPASGGGIPAELITAGAVALVLVVAFAALAVNIKRRLGGPDAGR